MSRKHQLNLRQKPKVIDAKFYPFERPDAFRIRVTFANQAGAMMVIREHPIGLEITEHLCSGVEGGELRWLVNREFEMRKVRDDFERANVDPVQFIKRIR